MRVAVDISLYPLDADFIPPIKDVIERLNRHAGIEVVTNPMATQLRGEYDTVMDALKQEIGVTFTNGLNVVNALHQRQDRCNVGKRLIVFRDVGNSDQTVDTVQLFNIEAIFHLLFVERLTTPAFQIVAKVGILVQGKRVRFG